MEGINKTTNKLIRSTEKILNRGLDNIYINTSLKVFIGLYAAFAAPKLPPSLVNLMDNILVRIAFAFVIVFISLREPSMALVIAIAFVVTLQTANKYRLINTSLSQTPIGEISWLQSVKELFFASEIPQSNNNTTIVGNATNAVPGSPETGNNGSAQVPNNLNTPEVQNNMTTGEVLNSNLDISSETMNKIREIACDNNTNPNTSVTQGQVDGTAEQQVPVTSEQQVPAQQTAVQQTTTETPVEQFYNLENANENNGPPVLKKTPELNELQTMKNYMPSNNLLLKVDQIVASEPNETQNSVNPFTSSNQFINAQVNSVPNANQNSCTGSFKNTMCAQGLYGNSPNGV